MVGSDLVGVEELLDSEKGLLLGNLCVVVAELVEICEGFGNREDKGRIVARGGVYVYRGGAPSVSYADSLVKSS